MPELREGEAAALAERYNAEPHHPRCATVADKLPECNCFKSSYPVHVLATALAASQEKERQLREALEQIADPSYVGNYKPDEVVAIYRKWAVNTLDSTQTHGEGPRGA